MEDKACCASSSARSGLQHVASGPATGKEDLSCVDLNELMKELNNTFPTSGMSKEKEQEITILQREIKEQHDNLRQYQFILACVDDVIKGKKISATTAEKVTNLIAADKEAEFFKNCPMDTNPLGLLTGTSSKDSELLFEEAAELRKAVEETIVEKSIAMRTEEDESARPSIDKSNLLNLNAQLVEAECKYNASLLEALTLVKELSDYKVAFAELKRSLAESLVEELGATSLKAKVLDCQVTNAMYSEDKNVERAINKIDPALKLEMESVSQQLKELKAQKAKYDHLRGTEEYEKILKEYTVVKNAIEDKKWLLRQCE